jgi:phage shock protein A
MGVFRRFGNYVKSKLNKWLDKSEDPIELLDYANTQYREKYRDVKKSSIIVKTNRKRLEVQADSLRERIVEATTKAKASLKYGKQSLAEKYLKLKLEYQEQLRSLEKQIETVQAQEEKIDGVVIKLKSQLDQHDTKRKTLEANYRASKAQSEIGEALMGIDTNSNLKESVELAEEKIRDLEARSAAINETLETEEKEDPDKELEGLIDSENVSREMELLRKELEGADKSTKEGTTVVKKEL